MLLAMMLATEPGTYSGDVILAQYGAIGAIAILAVIGVKYMTQREIKRADRLEEELRKLNETVRNQYITTISESARAIADANEAVANALSALRQGGQR